MAGKGAIALIALLVLVIIVLAVYIAGMQSAQRASHNESSNPYQPYNGTSTSAIANVTQTKTNSTGTAAQKPENTTNSTQGEDYVTEAQVKDIVPSNVNGSGLNVYNVTVYSTPGEIAKYISEASSPYKDAINSSNPTYVAVSNYYRNVNNQLAFSFQAVIINTTKPLQLYDQLLQDGLNYYESNATVNGMTYSETSFSDSKGEVFSLYGYKDDQVAIIVYQGIYEINGTAASNSIASDMR